MACFLTVQSVSGVAWTLGPTILEKWLESKVYAKTVGGYTMAEIKMKPEIRGACLVAAPLWVLVSLVFLGPVDHPTWARALGAIACAVLGVLLGLIGWRVNED
jgi:ABC-type branched-subunit amino acid transport system permease subunit